MSFHILHLTTSNCLISSENGLLFCKFKDEETKIIPLYDLRAIIVAAFGVAFSNNAISKLLENNTIILHCNNKYQPIGWSMPLERIVKTKIFYNQISQNEAFENELWKKILKRKVLNQSQCLELLNLDNTKIEKLINKPLMNEANIARQYWQNYFSKFDDNLKREHKDAQNFENACLNYGYAVLKSLIFRSILIHGLIPALGIHHVGNYKTTPLVYDLIEPFRPFVDYYFYKFKIENPDDYEFEDYKEWFKYFANCIKDYKLKIDKNNYKIIDSIELYIEKIANSFNDFNCENIFLPELKNQILSKINPQKEADNEE